MRLALVIAAFVATSCGKDLAQLAPFPCATDASCPSAYLCVDQGLCQPIETCELVATRKTCTTTARPRCVVVQTPGNVYTSQCVYDNGSTAHEGDFCGALSTTQFDSNGGCPNGMACYNPINYGGASEPANYCRLYCASDADCSNGNRCAFAFTGTAFSTVNDRGVCEPPCSPFGAACATTGYHCDAMTAITGSGGVLTCRVDGASAEGGDCTSQNCQAGLLCVPSIPGVQPTPTCRVPCDASHACASGSCNPGSFALPNAIGFCH